MTAPRFGVPVDYPPLTDMEIRQLINRLNTAGDSWLLAVSVNETPAPRPRTMRFDIELDRWRIVMPHGETIVRPKDHGWLHLDAAGQPAPLYKGRAGG